MNNDKIELHVHLHVEESQLKNMTIDEQMRMYERTLRPAIKEWIERGIFMPSERDRKYKDGIYQDGKRRTHTISFDTLSGMTPEQGKILTDTVNRAVK